MPNADLPFDRDLASALDALDYPVRPASVDDVIQRARARSAQRRWRFAAAAVVMLAASAAAALPGSPVRRWVVAVLRNASMDVPPGAPRRPEPTPVPSTADMRGVVAFVADSADVVFTAWQDSGVVVLRLVPGSELRVRSADSAAGYQVRPSGILINNTGARASYELAAPDNVRLRLSANGRVLFEQRAGRVVIGPLPRADGAYVISLRREGRR